MPPKRKAAAVESVESDQYESQEEGALSEQDTYDRLRSMYDVEEMSKRARESHATDAVSHLFRKSDMWDARLKRDFLQRPLWVDDTGHIIVESFSPNFHDAQTFLINVAEPQSRVSRMHEYHLTTHSLFAAVSVGLSTENIIAKLDRFSKTELSKSVRNFIHASTSSFGKAKIVLRRTLSYIECDDLSVLQRLLQDETVASCRADPSNGLLRAAAPQRGAIAIPGTKGASDANKVVGQAGDANAPQNPGATSNLLKEDDEEDTNQVHAFQIKSEERAKVIKRCQDLGLPLTEEYDFNNDEVNATLDINLRSGCRIRDYQEAALAKMFGNGRARSGIIVLPCGAGKTLVGITAACTVRKSIIVLCTSAMSVVQWRAEFIKWSNIDPSDIAVFTSESKGKFPRDAGIVISTYTMITSNRNRSYDSEKVMEFIRTREWGLLIADEVHVVPANIFQKVTYSIASHSKLGSSRCLFRE